MIVGVVVFVVSAALMTSMGGAGIVAAPITLPALYLVVRNHPSPAFRVAGAVIGALTAAEVAWAAVYLSAGEGTPATWLVPVIAAIAFGYLIAVRTTPGARPAPSG